MHTLKLIGLTLLGLISFYSYPLYAQSDSLGQSIQIYTRLHSFVGRPSWLLVIRDIDNGQNIPYVYDFYHGNNFWLAFTFSRNYLITASTLSFSPYSRDPDKTKVIHNFCHLESQGLISHGQSLTIQISGDLSPNPSTFICNVARYNDSNFYIAQPNASSG